MTTLLDANILIAVLKHDDAHHERVMAFLATNTDSLCVPALSLAEAMVNQVRAGRGQQSYDAVLAMGTQVLPGELVAPLELARTRVETGLRMPDCVVLASAQAVNAKLATTDARLARAAKQAGVVLASVSEALSG